MFKPDKLVPVGILGLVVAVHRFRVIGVPDSVTGHGISRVAEEAGEVNLFLQLKKTFFQLPAGVLNPGIDNGFRSITPAVVDALTHLVDITSELGSGKIACIFTFTGTAGTGIHCIHEHTGTILVQYLDHGMHVDVVGEIVADRILEEVQRGFPDGLGLGTALDTHGNILDFRMDEGYQVCEPGDLVAGACVNLVGNSVEQSVGQLVIVGYFLRVELFNRFH